jgi:hypothetical protein
MDFKLQAFKDDRNVGDWDQRKSAGEFRGAEEGMNVKTVMEFRAGDELSKMLTDPDELSKFIQPGDNAITVANRIVDSFKLAEKGIIGPLKAALPWNQVGIFAYDND